MKNGTDRTDASSAKRKIFRQARGSLRETDRSAVGRNVESSASKPPVSSIKCGGDRSVLTAGVSARNGMDPMIFLLDNYDSFTYNLVQRLGEIDDTLEIRVERNDQITLDEIAELKPDRIIISPGPCTPAEAGLSRDVIRRFGPEVPVLGVCLGHQCLADVYGAQVTRAGRLMHGKTSWIEHNETGVFQNLPNPFEATRYHSLIVPRESVPDCLIVTAWVNEPEYGFEVMGLQHREFPVHGVQFHPESFLTGQGHDLLRNFLAI